MGIGTREHTLSGLQCLLTGHHFARYELWDAIRGVDYLLTRDDVDPARLAVAGNSGGGTQAAYLAVVEPRLAVAVSSCYMTSWKQLWFEPGPQDAEQDLPGFLAHGLDFADYATAFAPRPFQILSATRDFFPIAGARSAYEEARGVYERLGAADRVGFFEYDDPHGWSKPRREATYRWLERWLHDRADAGDETALDTELESDLYATPTGQVSTSYDGRGDRPEPQPGGGGGDVPEASGRRSRRAEDLRRLVRSRLKMTQPSRHPTVTLRGVLEPRRLPHREDRARTPRRASPYPPWSSSRTEDPPASRRSSTCTGPARAAAGRRGRGPRGPGPLRPRRAGPGPPGYRREPPTAASGGYRPVWQMLQRALLVDRTLVGMQVEDLLASVRRTSQSREDVDPDRIAVLGRGSGGILALALAVLQPKVEKVALEGTVLSYLEIAGPAYHEDLVAVLRAGGPEGLRPARPRRGARPPAPLDRRPRSPTQAPWWPSTAPGASTSRPWPLATTSARDIRTPSASSTVPRAGLSGRCTQTG